MDLDYIKLKNKYLKFFDGNEENFNFIVTDVIFAFNEIKDYLNSRKYKNVLEVGCGTGILLKELKDNYGKIEFCGLDPNESGFHGYEGISNNIISTDKNLNIIKKDINNFNFKKKFDLIFSFNVFEHILDQEKYLKQTNSLLNENGLSIIFSPNYDFPYEPHFVLPIIFNKKITKKIFNKKIDLHEAKTKEIGLWEGLNLNGKKKIEKLLKKNKIIYSFDLSIKERMISRVFSDKIFSKRQGIAAKILKLAKLFFLDKIIFDILRIPFPYLKLVLKK